MTSSVETRKKSDQDKCFLKIMLFFVFFDELGFAEILAGSPHFTRFHFARSSLYTRFINFPKKIHITRFPHFTRSKSEQIHHLIHKIKIWATKLVHKIELLQPLMILKGNLTLFLNFFMEKGDISVYWKPSEKKIYFVSLYTNFTLHDFFRKIKIV